MGSEDHPLRKRRTEMGLRLEDVAARAGVSTALLSMTENGYVPTKKTRRRSLAEAVGLSADDVWPQEDNTP